MKFLYFLKEEEKMKQNKNLKLILLILIIVLLSIISFGGIFVQNKGLIDNKMPEYYNKEQNIMKLLLYNFILKSKINNWTN